MNAPANSLHPAQPEPQRLDDLASDHYWRLVHLRDLLNLMERVQLEAPPGDDLQDNTMQAMIFSALESARIAAKEAERLDVNTNTCGHSLMAVPVELLAGDAKRMSSLPTNDGWQQVRAAMRIATGADATVEDLTHAFEMVHELASEDEAYATDLEALTRILALRGYAVDWLESMGHRQPRLSPLNVGNIPGLLTLKAANTDEAFFAGAAVFIAEIGSHLDKTQLLVAVQAFGLGLKTFHASLLKGLSGTIQIGEVEHETA